MHVLVVGGTGMLADVALHLAGRGDVVSVIGRSATKHDTLCRRAQDLSGSINPLRLDYRDGIELAAALRQSVREHSHITAAICWIHRTAPDAHRQIAAILAEGDSGCRYVDVLGSTSAGPVATERAAWLQALPGLDYRRVLLGCVYAPAGWRWLTDDEISAGVIAALYSEQESYQVGSPVPADQAIK